MKKYKQSLIVNNNNSQTSKNTFSCPCSKQLYRAHTRILKAETSKAKRYTHTPVQTHMLLRIHQHRIEQRIPAALANRKSKTTLTTAIANSRPTNVAYYPISSGTSVTRSKAGLFEFCATFYQLLICLSLMSLPQSAGFFFFCVSVWDLLPFC